MYDARVIYIRHAAVSPRHIGLVPPVIDERQKASAMMMSADICKHTPRLDTEQRETTLHGRGEEMDTMMLHVYSKQQTSSVSSELSQSVAPEAYDIRVDSRSPTKME